MMMKRGWEIEMDVVCSLDVDVADRQGQLLLLLPSQLLGETNACHVMLMTMRMVPLHAVQTAS